MAWLGLGLAVDWPFLSFSTSCCDGEHFRRAPQSQRGSLRLWRAALVCMRGILSPQHKFDDSGTAAPEINKTFACDIASSKDALT